MKNPKISSFIALTIILSLFILLSYFAQKNIGLFRNASEDSGFLLILIYILLVILAIVVAPISTISILPIASGLWGWFYAALYSVAGWLIGSIIAFSIARKYGKPLVKNLMNLDRIEKIEKIMPKSNLFFGLIFLRMVIPVDILSYALGLFTKVRKETFIITTLIGILPFAFIFSYLGTVPIIYQIISFSIGAVIFLIGWYLASKKIMK